MEAWIQRLKDTGPTVMERNLYVRELKQKQKINKLIYLRSGNDRKI